VSRDQWSVDDDLSRLKDEIKGSMSQHRNSDDDEPVHHGHHQQIKGNSNVQVAGNLTLNEHKTIDPNHPDAIECPQCRKLTYRLSHWCTECNFNLHDYWADLAKKRERSRFIKVMLFCGISGLLIIFAGTMFLTGKDVLYPLGIGGGLVAMAYAASLRIDKI
jgi:hypothetical protein